MSDPDENKDVQAQCLCSVLNTVVDFVMVPPSDFFEPLEFKLQETKSSIRVPVIRIFGPSVRHLDQNHFQTGATNPTQSACLYVHGVFPYMMARPVEAGPDGSGIPGNCPWDSMIAVQQMVPELTERLEAAISECAPSHTGGADSKISRDHKVQHQRTIRRITVVLGRGFYTYCPGPAAPFLKVEYYAPSDRWKVKRSLETGLVDMPTRTYHPCRHSITDHSIEEHLEAHPADEKKLCFNCYEAHIPYTMQFFKDWNLAGMSYVHVSCDSDLVKFRSPLPTSTRKSCLALSVSGEIPSSRLFLAFNTPEIYKWIRSSSTSYATSNNLTFPRVDKMTSCDIELDTAVCSILNVQNIMTHLSEEDKECIHWRAVPSLGEIWSQERRRMARLLSSQHNFLSCTESPQKAHFTLNVKKGEAMPGTRLARDGMQRLVSVTNALEETFRRALKQIVARHADKVKLADDRLRKSKQSDNNVCGRNEVSTPSTSDTLKALGALGNQFDTAQSQSSTKLSANFDIESAGAQYLSQESDQTSTGIDRFASLSQDFMTMSSENTRSLKLYSLRDEFLLSQRVERGDGLVVEGAFHQIDDVIDPKTLAPFSSVHDEGEESSMLEKDDMEEERKLELELMALATEAMLEKIEIEEEDDVSREPSEPLLALFKDDISDNSKPFNETSDSESATATFPIKVCSREITSKHNSDGVATSIHPNASLLLQCRNSLVARRESPPSKSDIVKSAAKTSLYPKKIDGGVIDWAPLLMSYEICNERFPPNDLVSKNDEFGEIRSVKSPPLCGAVELWHIKFRKKKLIDAYKSKDFRELSWSRSNEETNCHINDTSFNQDTVPLPEGLNIENVGIQEVDVGGSQPVWFSAETQETESLLKAAAYGVQPFVDNINNEKETPKNRFAQLDQESSKRLQSSHTSSSEPILTTVSPDDALLSLGMQEGKVYVERIGRMKTRRENTQGSAVVKENKESSLSCPVSIMAIEVHIQCREGHADSNSSHKISMTPDSDKDRILAVLCVFGRDPGGGEAFEFLERVCIFVPLEQEINSTLRDGQPRLNCLSTKFRRSIPRVTMGVASALSVECVGDERQLLLRLGSIVRSRDPDMLISWDTQGSGLGYLIERGIALGKTASLGDRNEQELNMARLLGRTPTQEGKLELNPKSEEADSESFSKKNSNTSNANDRWTGSGLGSDWDERVGAGAAAASICGRLVFAAWKIIADEVKHPNCSYLPSVVSSVLNKRIPHHENLKLAEWYCFDYGRERWRVFHYKFTQAIACLQLFDALDIVGRSGEAARLSGVELSQSFPGIRGSQYKVEGVLLRALKSLSSDERGSKRGRKKCSGVKSLSVESKSQSQSPWKLRRSAKELTEKQAVHHLFERSYFFFSPSLQDTNKQEALETQALTLEPVTGHHHDPVVVCDFTALYPSLIIAYNLCYSTCSGKLDYHSTRDEMLQEGRTTGRIGPIEYPEERTATVLKHHFKSLTDDTPEEQDRAYVAPTGTIFVSEYVVKGVIPQVLDEILSTRAMLKKAAKEYKKRVPNLSQSILRQLEARQLALKYVANVTYGYTSATFSGRCAMPLLADTIVECGRRTLTNAINIANRWGREPDGRWQNVEVIYGDTDSIFVKLPGRSVQEAFLFGEEFCNAVTDSNPPPVQLKLEKVYVGSMMQTKKKYCGMKYDSNDQKRPSFEAKGLEIVRRDQCQLTQSILRNSLITLYQSGIEAVKAYLIRQWALIESGRVSISDFILTGRVQSRYRGGRVGPVQAVLARRLAEMDPGRVVRHKERQAYVIVANSSVTVKLKDCVLTPLELLEQWDSYTIHISYYITRHVNAALQRCLGLPPYRIDVSAWFESSRKRRQRLHFWPSTRSKQSTSMISTFFGSDQCSVCGRKCTSVGRSRAAVCQYCQQNSFYAVGSITNNLRLIQQAATAVAGKCRDCNLCFEDATTFAVTRVSASLNQSTNGILVRPIANCTCIDCPSTYERHRLRESELEAIAVCDILSDV